MGPVTMSKRDLRRIQVLADVLAGRRAEFSFAAILGLSTRQTDRASRWCGGALIHKVRGRTSNNRLVPGIREYVIELGSVALCRSRPQWHLQKYFRIEVAGDDDFRA
jgi:hypothetical protein